MLGRAVESREFFFQELECRLRKATQGYVQELALDELDSSLFVHFRADAYYGLQLAIAAVHQALLMDGCPPFIRLSAEVRGTYFRLSLAKLSQEEAPLENFDGYGSQTHGEKAFA